VLPAEPSRAFDDGVVASLWRKGSCSAVNIEAVVPRRSDRGCPLMFDS
jgi:hypothetical protein